MTKRKDMCAANQHAVTASTTHHTSTHTHTLPTLPPAQQPKSSPPTTRPPTHLQCPTARPPIQLRVAAINCRCSCCRQRVFSTSAATLTAATTPASAPHVFTNTQHEPRVMGIPLEVNNFLLFWR